jgi:hypothetical protein
VSWLFALLLLPLFAAPSLSRAQNPRVGAADFDRKAFAALPAEPSYTFYKELTEGVDPELGRRDPTAKPASGEIAVANRGWTLVIHSGVGSPLREAAQSLRSYLTKAMQVELDMQEKPSLADWPTSKQVIIAGTREDLSGCGAALKGAKDYQIMVSPDRIVVCGYDEAGAMYALYNLEERVSLREAPYLPRDLNTIRHSLYKARMTLSGLGWMEWPDAYLAMLARYGFDSIYASAYANPNGVPGPAPFWDKFRRQDPARVHDLVRRAERYGIRLYCPIIYRYTGTPENEEGLRKLVRDIVTEFPQIRGYVLLTEGFDNATDPWDYKGDIHDWVKTWARAVNIVVQECHKLNPVIEVLPWEYNIDFRPESVNLKRFAIDQLPQDSIPLVTFENGKDFVFDGEHSFLKDYAISQIGPSEVAEAQIREAQKRGMPGIYAKADTWASWEYGTFPYLPFPFQWYARYQALGKYGIDGVLESWSYGFKPNFVAELRAWYSWTDAPSLETLLRQMARRDFGAGNEGLVLSAWKSFSTAITYDPDTGPTAGGNAAVANPLFFQQPTSHILTLQHSWTDQENWSKDSYLNPYWPYVFRGWIDGYVLYPDFSNRTNVAEDYAKPMSLRVFNKYLLKAADEMEKGLESYRTAALNASASKRPQALREVLLAEQIERMMRSDEAMLEFEDLRFRLAKTEAPEEQKRILDRMTEILKDELPRTNAALETARRDSRLGYEWEEDYIYWPETIERKIELLKKTLNEEIPSYRRQHRVP